MRLSFLLVLLYCLFFSYGQTNLKEEPAVDNSEAPVSEPQSTKANVLYGTASFYADKFNGRKTANGETYNHSKFTAACNVLPLGTWIRVTNMKNNKSVIVRVNDRLHYRMKRLVDLSKNAAVQLGYIRSGLTKVKVEVLGKKR